MKRLMSLVLAAIMLLGFLPATAVPVSAAEPTAPLQAYYTDKNMSIDGLLREEHWLLRDKVGSTPISMLCNQDSLYVALQTGENEVEFTINGVTLMANLAVGAVLIGAEKVGVAAKDAANGTAEMEIPLSEINVLYSVGQEVPFSCKVGTDRYDGTAVLAAKAVRLAQSFDDISQQPYASKLGNPQTGEVFGEQGENGSLHIGTGTLTETGSSLGQPAWTLEAMNLDTTQGYEMSFIADFNDLTVSAPGQEAYVALAGIAFDLRGEVYLRHGFSADKNGNLVVTQYENTADLTKVIDTGYDLPVKNLFVQIVVNDNFEVEVFLNGKSTAKFGTTTRRTTAGRFNIETTTLRRDTSLPNKNDINLYDLLITQAAPDEQISVNKVANTADLKLDGTLAEMLWALPYSVGGTRYGLLYDAENLYIALDTQQTQVEFLFGDQSATAKLGKKPTFALGYTMGSTIAGNGNGQYEIKVPRSLLKVAEPIPFTVLSDGQTRKSELTLSNTAITVTERQPAAGDGKVGAIAYLNTDKVKLDGKLKENHWYTPYQTAGASGSISTDIGFMWDANYLYVGAEMFSRSRAQSLNLTVNGKSFQANLAAGTASAGDVVVDGQTLEWRVPLTAIGLPVGGNVDTTFKLDVVGETGTSTTQGNLKLEATVVVFGDTCNDVNTKDYVLASGKMKGTYWEQGNDAYALTCDPTFTGNEYITKYTPLLNYEGGAYEFVLDMTIHSLPNNPRTLGWRGLNFEIRQPALQTRFALRGDGNGNVLFDVLNRRNAATLDTGIDFGERAIIKFKVDENLNPTLYVNDKQIGGFPALDRTSFTINDSLHMPRMIIEQLNYDRDPDADGTLSGINVDIHDILWTQVYFTDAKTAAASAMETISQDNLLLGASADDVTRLYLMDSISDTNTGATSTVTWKAIDKSTGKIAANVNTETGVITRADKPLYFDLIATVTYEGVGVSKTFTLQTKGKTPAGSVALLVEDTNPLTGKVETWGGNSFEYFDTTHNSLVFDQGSSKEFNTIKLYDFDDFSRMSKQHLGVFVSEDGANYTKINGWHLHQDGNEYTIYNLSAKARYVKVHTYHDDLDNTGVQPSFYNAVSDMMAVSYNSNLAGANGAFANKADYVVKNPTDKAVKDYPAFISLTDLGAKAGQYKNGCADFRFTMGGQQLAYWYNGVDGFHVRIPDMAAGGSATVTAHWGCSSAADFSDAESVFEVTYGNVTLIDLTRTTGLASHGRPFTMPNGDIVVAGRTSDTNGNLGFVRSTDGGRTFNPVPEMVARDADYPGRAFGFGGFLYDEALGRVWVIGYSASASNKQDMRLVLSYSDDSGKTWSEPRFMTLPDMPTIRDNDIILQNAIPTATYVMTYCDGITLRDADGKGPNVDYIIAADGSDYTIHRNFTQCFYSADGGETWSCSELIYVDIDNIGNNAEHGVTEPTITQLDDGSLYMLIRAQIPDNHYLYEARSTDSGKTWTSGYSKVISANTSPVLTTYNDQRVLLWTSMNGLGGTSYRRTPMHVGFTSDNYATFDHIIDVVFGTSYDSLEEMYTHMTQPGLTFTKDGKDALAAFWDANQLRRYDERATNAVLMEDFSDLVNYTKGGYEDFETVNLKYEGWLTVDGVIVELSREAATSGMQSMKIADVNPGTAIHATRQVPSMKFGTVGAKMMVPATNSEYFALELKAGFNFTHMQHTLAAVAVNGDGTVALCYDNEKIPVAKVTPGSWNDYAISFDIATGMGKLSVNGKVVSDIKLETGEYMFGEMRQDVVREISCVQFMQTSATAGVGDCLYVDDFYATELTSALSRTVYNINFADVKQGDWYFDAVNFAVENGIMSGYNATKFGPNDTLNRAMVVQVLYNKEGQPDLGGAKHSFSDVPASQWYNNAVTWGSSRGVVSGYGGGVFKPEDAVTIEQVAVILWNYSNTPAGYGDPNKAGSHSDWAANALKWAVEKGILNNVPFTNATEKATRAQTAQMLTNYLRG
ncbi:MAG: S-layer homology domain-containing protein [Oscillospiraceae bacterium]|nr:S-layer homology domain-containing protein [Oscillospiraceae bacterium]